MRYAAAPAPREGPMSSDPKPPPPLPSAEQIQAYVELSAARTKKRLTLAAGNARPEPAAARGERKLPTGRAAVNTGENALEKAVEKPAAPPEAVPGAEASDAPWQPFTDEEEC
jgi:hypothetical protein